MIRWGVSVNPRDSNEVLGLFNGVSKLCPGGIFSRPLKGVIKYPDGIIAVARELLGRHTVPAGLHPSVEIYNHLFLRIRIIQLRGHTGLAGGQLNTLDRFLPHTQGKGKTPAMGGKDWHVDSLGAKVSHNHRSRGAIGIEKENVIVFQLIFDLENLRCHVRVSSLKGFLADMNL